MIDTFCFFCLINCDFWYYLLLNAYFHFFFLFLNYAFERTFILRYQIIFVLFLLRNFKFLIKGFIWSVHWFITHDFIRRRLALFLSF